MSFIGGEVPDTDQNFLNYVLGSRRKEFSTERSLVADGWQLYRPFKLQRLQSDAPRAPVEVQGAADGGEGTLPS